MRDLGRRTPRAGWAQRGTVGIAIPGHHQPANRAGEERELHLADRPSAGQGSRRSARPAGARRQRRQLLRAVRSHRWRGGAASDVVFGVIAGHRRRRRRVSSAASVLDRRACHRRRMGPQSPARTRAQTNCRARTAIAADAAASKPGAAARAFAAQFRATTGRSWTPPKSPPRRPTMPAQRAMERLSTTAWRAALAGIVNMLDPDAIVLGGGLSNIDALYRELPPRVERYAFTPEGPTAIVKNLHGDSSGVRGAAWLWREDGGRRLAAMSAFCRDCLADARRGATRCKACGSRRILSPCRTATRSPSPIWTAMPSMRPSKSATIPTLVDKPVIVGGGKRGVVSTCCYMARISGVRSAMPMFQALKLCPQAVVIRRTWRNMPRPPSRSAPSMRDLTPLVEPLSLDEAYLDLSGTERLHGTVARPRPWRSCQRASKRDRHHRLGRAQLQQVPGQARLRSRQAARLRGDRPGRSQERSCATSPSASSAASARRLQAGWPRTASPTSPSCRTPIRKMLAERYGNTGLWLHRLANARRQPRRRSRRAR